MNPTEEQTHILSLANVQDNLLINALAGTGKTSTLEMFERATKTKPVLYLVFNKRNAKEAETRMLSTTTVRTFNSLGHRIWAKATGKNLSLSPKKSQEILRGIINEVPKRDQGPIWDVFWDVVQGVGMAKALGYIPEGKYEHAKRLCTQGEFHASLDESPDDFVSDLIDAVLTKSIKLAYEGNIDYNDQIYMSALFGGTYPQFPLVMVDESQDLSPVNHAMLDKLGKGRLCAVGDPWQNIYGFRGAKSGGMGSIAERFSTTSCDLSISFRCPKAIVEHVHWRVPHFKWMKGGGHVEELKELPSADIGDGATILCRNNAPLFKCAMQLLSTGRSVQVVGSEIGPKLIGIMRKLCDENSSKETTIAAIDLWLEERSAKGSKTAKDLADCMKVFAEHGNDLGQAIHYAEHLFAQQGKIQLMTGHKSKGLEFDTVYHLDPWLLSEDEQDLNLRYVISTRSKDRLFEIESRNIRW